MQAPVITWILMFAIILSFFFMSCGSPKEIDNTTMQYELDTIASKCDICVLKLVILMEGLSPLYEML